MVQIIILKNVKFSDFQKFSRKGTTTIKRLNLSTIKQKYIKKKVDKKSISTVKFKLFTTCIKPALPFEQIPPF